MAKIFIGLGSNIKPKKHLEIGINQLKIQFGELVLSSVFESVPVGFSGDNFLNMVASADTSLSIEQVVHALKSIEFANGRAKNAVKFSSRTLDLDLLLYDDVVTKLPVHLPRPEITENAFVLQPLAEIAPKTLHPVLQQSYQNLWQNYPREQALWQVNCQFNQ